MYFLNQNFIIFLEKNVILEQCKEVHCVDLGESFQTHTSIYLQIVASIQPRTSPVKFARPRPNKLRVGGEARGNCVEPGGASPCANGFAAKYTASLFFENSRVDGE